MGVQSLHYLAPVKIGNTGLGGITATDNPIRNEIRDEPSSGELTARIQALAGQGFDPSFTTQDIAAALAACGAMGCALAASPLNLYAQAGSDDGRRAAGGHTMYTYQHGLLLPQSLECNHQGDCSLSYAAVVTWDGVHDPLVVSDGASLPAIDATSLWTLQSASLGGVAVPQLRSVRLNFGLKAEAEGADSDIWASRPSVSAIQPVITVTTTRISALLPLIGDSGTFSLVFREREEGGTFTAHTLTLSGSGLANFTKPFGARGNRPGEADLEARPKYDGANDPIIISRNW
jgi:hypothetical protein